MNDIRDTNDVVAIFDDRATAEHARDTLIANGFRPEQLEMTSADDFARDAAIGNAGLTGQHHHEAGGISGFFHRLFNTDDDRDERDYYTRNVRDRRSALVVHADERSIDRAADILNDAGAIRIEDAADRVESRPMTSRDDRRREGESIPVVNEELRVGKRAVQRGGVRVYSRLTEQPVQESVPLREERVRVDRRPADRPATEADFAAAERGVIEVRETAEEPVIEKVARVVEEVVVTKDVRERTENVQDTVRRSDVRVEDAKGSARFDDTDFRNDFRTRYGDQYRYEEYAPAYQYGYDMASNPRYRGRRYEDVEDEIRTDYLRRNPNSAWDRMKGAVRYGWEKVTGKR